MNAERFAETALGKRRVSVCVGCGGVGKTTVAAALALEAARRSRKVLVLTIDPARRLADALGVAELGNDPQPIARDALERHRVPEAGELWAMMLDMKRTFDDLVERFADGPEARDRILSNPIYQHVSDALAGSVEYSAMEKVFELSETGRFDLIVVDTPPAQHALDFLEAPDRLLEFLDSRLVQVLIHPAFAAGRFGFRLFQRGTRRVLQVLERLTGIGFLADISEFLLAFEGMAEGFRERARRVRSLLLGPDATFVLVAGPAHESVRQSLDFLARLDAYSVPLSGVLVNRVRAWPGGGEPPEPLTEPCLDPLRDALAAAHGAGFPAEAAARAALASAGVYADLVRRDAREIQTLRQRTEARGAYFGTIPELPADVHDLDGLARVIEAVLEPRPEGGA